MNRALSAGAIVLPVSRKTSAPISLALAMNGACSRSMASRITEGFSFTIGVGSAIDTGAFTFGSESLVFLTLVFLPGRAAFLGGIPASMPSRSPRWGVVEPSGLPYKVVNRIDFGRRDILSLPDLVKANIFGRFCQPFLSLLFSEPSEWERPGFAS